MGRPKGGALSQTCAAIVQEITQMRRNHPGWGPITILIELKKQARFVGQSLPSRSRIAAYFKRQGWVRPYERHQPLPQPKPQVVERPHQEWELDAQGTIQVHGLGRVSIINVMDLFSHVKVGSLACQGTSHANTQENQLVLRQAFLRYGLPEQISLDHDSVYYDNRTPSPFPTVFHLWLIGLGIQVRFIDRTPPEEHAHIERGHQTVIQQAVIGQSFEGAGDLQAGLDDRLDFLNQEYPSRSLQGRPPLSAYPQARQNPRSYRPEWELEMLDLQRVYAYLAQGRWFRNTSQVGMFSLGAQRYNARMKHANQTLEINFDPQSCEFICLSEKSTQPFRLAALGLTKATLLGELDPLLSLPAYQLALPITPQAWREMLLCQQMTGMTL
jgi:hypothetical protein